MNGLRAGLLAFSLLTPVSGGAFADEASEALARSFVDSIDKLDGWSAKAASIASEGNATVIKGLSLKTDAGDAELAAGAIRFEDLKSGDSGMSSTAFSFADMSIKSGGILSLSVPLAEGRDIKVPSFKDWVYDPKKPVRSIALAYTRIAKTELDSFVIPAATYEQKVVAIGAPAPVTVKGAYENIRYENLKGGILASQSIGKISSTSTSSDPAVPEVSFAWEGMSAKNTDLNAMARVIDPAEYKDGKGDGQWVNAVESGTYGKMSFSSGGKSTGSIASITFGAMQMRQPEKPFIDALDEMIALGAKPDDAKMLAFMEEHLSSLTGWFKITSMAMDGLEILPPDGGKVVLAKASIEDLSADGLKRFAIEGFSAEAPDFMAKMKLFEVADVVWPSLQAYMKIGAMAETQRTTGAPPDPAKVAAIADNFFELYPRIGRIAIDGVEAGQPQLGQVFSLASYLATTTGDFEGGAPLVSNVEMKSLVIPGALLRVDPQSAQVFDALGYDKLEFNVIGSGTYTSATGDYDTDATISVVDAGALKFTYSMGGLTPERLKGLMIPILSAGGKDPDPMALFAASAGMALKGFSFRFEDSSLTKRLLKFGAQMQGMDEATLIGNATAMAQLGMSQIQAPEFTKQTVEALTAFLNDPKSITIALKPPKPVEAVQVMGLDPTNPKAALELFGVTVTAND